MSERDRRGAIDTTATEEATAIRTLDTLDEADEGGCPSVLWIVLEPARLGKACFNRAHRIRS